MSSVSAAKYSLSEIERRIDDCMTTFKKPATEWPNACFICTGKIPAVHKAFVSFQPNAEQQARYLELKKEWSRHIEHLKQTPQLCLEPQNTLSNWKNTLLAIALATAAIPGFGLGILFGAAKYYAQGPVLSFFNSFLPPSPPADTKKWLDWNLHSLPIETTLAAPIVEEVFCRGIATRFIGIIPSAILFSAGHLDNVHSLGKFYAYRQVAICLFSGLLYGYLYEKYGLGAPLAAHMINNCLVAYSINRGLDKWRPQLRPLFFPEFSANESAPAAPSPSVLAEQEQTGQSLRRCSIINS